MKQEVSTCRYCGREIKFVTSRDRGFWMHDGTSTCYGRVESNELYGHLPPREYYAR